MFSFKTLQVASVAEPELVGRSRKPELRRLRLHLLGKQKLKALFLYHAWIQFNLLYKDK